MPYLNLDPNYTDHPKTRRLIIILGDMADCLPIRLWSYCAKYHPIDGKMMGYSQAEFEGAVLRWKGEPGKAVKAMKIVGFIFAGKNGYACVDWKQHQGHLEAFSRRGRIAAKARWNKYASSMQAGCLSNAPAVGAVPAKPAIEKAPVTSLSYCQYNDRGQGRCDQRAEVRSKYCPDHKMKVREKWLDKHAVKSPIKVTVKEMP